MPLDGSPLGADKVHEIRQTTGRRSYGLIGNGANHFHRLQIRVNSLHKTVDPRSFRMLDLRNSFLQEKKDFFNPFDFFKKRFIISKARPDTVKFYLS